MVGTKTIVLVGCDASAAVKEGLASRDFLVLELPYDERLPLPVRSHADMLLFSVGNFIFTSKTYFNKAQNVFSILRDHGYEIITSDVQIGNKYPQDIAFNMAVIGKNILGSLKHNAKEIIDFANERGFELISVNQGYTKCSSLILGNKGIITSDIGIANVVENLGVLVLKTENSAESVVLNGYNYGFIGGASGVLNNTVYFSGNVELHKQAKEICSFCQKLGFTTENLSDDILYDVGGIMFFPNLL